MSDNKNQVEAITNMEDDFAKWYTDVVLKADLIGYTTVKGCMAIKPYGYAIWENIMNELNKRFKATGVQNVSMPLFIPESLLQKEKDHVEGFAPEVAFVTHGGAEELQERLCVRPTSETLFCDFYAKDISSYRDLPRLYNQWCSVVRWEKTTRPFLRSREFLWQEGHTAHATKEEAIDRTLTMLNVYAEFCEDILAIPVIKGEKTEKEKFAGAVSTYTIEAMMHDGKALQSATSHYFGDGFAKAFDILFTDKDNVQKNVHQTSWGLSTRIIGAIIMTHGDNRGLKLPPEIAPIQVMIVPIRQEKEEVKEAVFSLKERLKKIVRADIDLTDKSPGYKYSEQEMRGIPLRLEIGPKDIEKGQVLLVRRDTQEKIAINLSEVETRVVDILKDIQENMYLCAKKNREEHTYSAETYEEFKKLFDRNNYFVKTRWCGSRSCEESIKEELSVSSRCMPFGEQDNVNGECIYCGKKAKNMVIFGKAY